MKALAMSRMTLAGAIVCGGLVLSSGTSAAAPAPVATVCAMHMASPDDVMDGPHMARRHFRSHHTASHSRKVGAMRLRYTAPCAVWSAVAIESDGKILPGLSSPNGSKTRLTARISSSATGSSA